MLDTLGIPMTSEDDVLPEWEDFSLLAAEDPSRVTQGLHVGFAAHARPEVDAFWRAGIDLGARTTARPGPRPQYRDDYYGGFLLDPDGNSAEAAHHGARREDGVIDHIWLRVSDVAASAAFYATVGRVAGHRVAEVSAEHVRSRARAARCRSWRGRRAATCTSRSPPTTTRRSTRSTPSPRAPGTRRTASPGERPEYHAGYYGAFVLDPDGNNIELVNHNR